MTYKIEVGRSISRTVAIWIQSFIPFTILSLIVNAPVVGATYLYLSGERSDTKIATIFLVQLALTFLAGSILTGAVSYAVFERLRGRAAGLGPALSVGFRSLFLVLGVSSVAGILVFVGCLLLVIPGLIVACTLAAAVPVAVVERANVGESLRRSAALTYGSRWAILLSILVLTILSGIVKEILEAVIVGSGSGAAATWDDAVFNMCVTQAIGSIFTPLTSVLSAVVYHDLRIGKEGASVEELVAVFD